MPLPKLRQTFVKDKHKLFVGSLPPDITDEEITSTFGTYGNVVEHHIMRGKSTSGQACAFVVLDSKAAGDNAISSMDNTMPVREGGTPIRVATEDMEVVVATAVVAVAVAAVTAVVDTAVVDTAVAAATTVAAVEVVVAVVDGADVARVNGAAAASGAAKTEAVRAHICAISFGNI
eukprot:g27500.t1